MQERRSENLRIFILFVLCLIGSSGIFLLVFTDLYYAKGIEVTGHGVVLGRDFVNLWIGGKHVWRGALDGLYDVTKYLAFMREYFPHQGEHNYSYPPPTLFIGAILSVLPYPLALAVWTVGTASLFLLAARRYVVGFPLVLAVLTPGAIANIWDGQYGFLVGALWLFLFANLDGKENDAGSAAAVLTIKPHLGLLIPLILLARRRFSAIKIAIIDTVGMVVISACVLRPELWAEYFQKVPGTQLDIMNSTNNVFYFHMMPTTMIAFHRYPYGIALTFQIITAAVALWLVWRARHTRAKSLAFIAATATFLILPYGFNYDMPVLCLGLVVLLSERWQTLAGWELNLLGLGVMTPVLVLMQETIWVPLAPAILLGCLFIQVKYALAAEPGRSAIEQVTVENSGDDEQDRARGVAGCSG